MVYKIAIVAGTSTRQRQRPIVDVQSSLRLVCWILPRHNHSLRSTLLCRIALLLLYTTHSRYYCLLVVVIVVNIIVLLLVIIWLLYCVYKVGQCRS